MPKANCRGGKKSRISKWEVLNIASEKVFEVIFTDWSGKKRQTRLKKSQIFQLRALIFPTRARQTFVRGGGGSPPPKKSVSVN